MIIYNVTVKVDAAVAEEWLHWLNGTDAPQILATGCFWKYHVLLLLELNDAEGPTYAVQYYAHTMADYEIFILHFAADFQKKAAIKWGNRFVSFSTPMEVLV